MNDVYFKIEAPNCKLCNARELRDEIDLLLLRETRKEDGSAYTQKEIELYCEERGLELSQSALSRHYANHVKPGVRAMLETQKQMEAISQATGKRLPLATVFSNIFLDKAVRLFDSLGDDFWDDIQGDPKLVLKYLGLANTAAKHAAMIERTEDLIDKKTITETVKNVAEKKGLSQETIEQIEREILGM